MTVWNRTGARARALAGSGIAVAESVTVAVAEADIVVTMLFDAASVREVMAEALPAMRSGAVWAQTSTVGLDGTASLAELAGGHGVEFVDAPVLGTRQPAENGELTVLASGPERVRDAVAPVFDAIGARTVWVGERPGDGHRLKLVANSWVLSVNAATAQAVALAGGLGLDPRQFLELISGGPLDCGYTQLKGKAMIAGEFPPSFGMDGAVKDATLIRTAMDEAKVDDTLMGALQELYRAAAESGHAEADMAAVVRAFQP
ncbi:MAG: NAD(P)-dependent oxidoreductase [Labedaea sp.]